MFKKQQTSGNFGVNTDGLDATGYFFLPNFKKKTQKSKVEGRKRKLVEKNDSVFSRNFNQFQRKKATIVFSIPFLSEIFS